MNRRTIISLGALLVLVGCLIFIASAPRRSGPWAPLSVAFLGYTNGPTGTQCAVFSITNRGNIPVAIASLAVELEEHAGEMTAPVFSPLPWPARLMEAGGSQTFAIVEPVQPGRWRVGLRFSRHTVRERLREYATNHRWHLFSGWVQQYSTNSVWVEH